MNLERNEVIKRIKTALQKRSGKQWSVTGGRGTAWGWIRIDAPPVRRTWGCRLKADASPAELPEDYERYDTGEPDRTISPQDAAELARLLGLDSVHNQGVHVASSSDYWDEYMARAEGRTPAKIAQPYWD